MIQLWVKTEKTMRNQHISMFECVYGKNQPRGSRNRDVSDAQCGTEGAD